MRFGTFYFFQAAPGLSHADVVHRELEQMEWTEELGFDQIWLTEHHFIDYGLAVDPASLAATAASLTRRVRIGAGRRHPALPSPAPAGRADGADRHHLEGAARRRRRPRQPAGGVQGLQRAAAGEQGAVRRGRRHHAEGVDGGPLRPLRPLLHDRRGARDPQALAAAASADLPGGRERRRHRELRRPRMADAQLRPHRARSSRSSSAATRTWRRSAATGAPRTRSPA